MTPLDVLVCAIKREEASIMLYERLHASASHHAALFKALIEEERRHKHRLELEYALLKKRRDRQQLPKGPQRDSSTFRSGSHS